MVKVKLKAGYKGISEFMKSGNTWGGLIASLICLPCSLLPSNLFLELAYLNIRSTNSLAYICNLMNHGWEVGKIYDYSCFNTITKPIITLHTTNCVVKFLYKHSNLFNINNTKDCYNISSSVMSI